MKKATVIVLLSLLALLAPAKEIRGLFGINWSKYLFSSEITDINPRNRSGLTIGLGWAIDLNPKMQVEIEALLGEKGAKTELVYAPGSSIHGIYKNTSIGIPVLFKYRLSNGASPYAAIGPEFVFILSHKLQIPDRDEEFNLADNTRKFALAFNALLGYRLPLGRWSLFAELRYCRWLSNILIDAEAAAKCESVSILLGGAFGL